MYKHMYYYSNVITFPVKTKYLHILKYTGQKTKTKRLQYKLKNQTNNLHKHYQQHYKHKLTNSYTHKQAVFAPRHN